jgi:dihydrolipoamide dehydrogenase
VSTVELRVPDIGDFKDALVAEVLVKPGDRLNANDPLITLETDKAAMDVPVFAAGTVASVAVKKGERVSKDSLIGTLDTADQAVPVPARPESAPPAAAPPAPTAAASAASAAKTIAAGALDLVVLGAGPGGYTAAFRAADLGLKVTLVERWPVLGGVCLNVGCIPSKALLHAAKVIEDAADMRACGISFAQPTIDFDRLRAWKNRVVGKLTNGLSALAKQRKVDVVHGEAQFAGPNAVEVRSATGTRRLEFKQCIIAAGSESMRLPGVPDDPRIMDSGGALEIPAECKRLLVVGGGIIGLEMACVYDALGVRVSVVELSDGLMPGTDRDLVRPLQKRIEKRYERILLNTKVSSIEPSSAGLKVTFEGSNAPAPERYDHVLIGGGRECGSTRHHRGRQANADQCCAYFRHRRHRRRPDACTQGHA